MQSRGSDPGADMNSDVRRAIEWDCQQTILRFTAAFDSNDYEQMAAHFAVDGVWNRPMGMVTGHEGLKDLHAKRSKNIFVRHLIGNTRVTVLSETVAKAESYLIVFRHDATGELKFPLPMNVELMGTYSDELKLVDGRWVLSARTALPLFKH